MTPETHVRQLHPLKLGARNLYGLGFKGNVLSRPGQPVEGLTLMLCGGIRGNGLFPHLKPGCHFAPHVRLKSVSLGRSGGRDSSFLKNLPLGVPGIGHKTETATPS